MLPTSLKELVIGAVFLAVGGLFYGLGQIVFGQREGGRRAVLLGIAFISGWLGSLLVRHLWDDVYAKQYPEAFLFFVGCIFVIFAVTLIAVSVFASDRKVKEYFDAVLGL